MKKFIALLFLVLCLLAFGSCKKDDTTPTTSNTTQSTQNSPEDYIVFLYGEWICTNGEREPIDENTVNGTPYILKDISRDERGDITYTLTVNNSDVLYKVYRYKEGYAEYSYMEADFTAKDAVFKFYKQ